MGLDYIELQKKAEREQCDREQLINEKLITQGMHENIALCAAIRDIARDPKTNGYAKVYAEAYFNLHHEYKDEELKEAKKIQILYVLNNITHWRGNRHSEIRKLLKENTK